ncbi:perforin-1-like [Tiliqua scincoides]|uniref:perforin-1-like n=1 Tax=Tiliqua scincoides TaxID=71010 RepID=UPI00346244B0
MQNKDPTSAACVFLLVLILTAVTPKCQKGTADEWKPRQRLPLIVSDWKAHTSCQQKVQQSVQQSFIAVAEALAELEVKNDWRKELDVKISRNDKVQWALAGSHSEATQRCIQKSSEDKYMFLLHHITCSHYKFHVGKDQFLSGDFERYINTLPEKYDPSSKSDYFELIRSYGTHFVTKLDVGAQAKYLSAIPVCEAVLEGTTASELSRCLAIHLGIVHGLAGVKNSSDFQMCEEKKKNPNFFCLIHIITTTTSTGDTEWMESAKSWPALLSYSLEPLHTLVDKADPRREGLRQAVSQYVRERALWKNCSRSCPPGSQPSASDFYSCECPNNNFTKPMCCEQKHGLAKLTVTIERADNWWGDRVTRSNGYVSVYFQERWMCIHTVWNNNHPTWNAILDFGVIQIHETPLKLQVEVWDEDHGWDDDLLGKCTLNVILWNIMPQSCPLNHGSVHFKYHFDCGPHLGGFSCRDYFIQISSNYYQHH